MWSVTSNTKQKDTTLANRLHNAASQQQKASTLLLTPWHCHWHHDIVIDTVKLPLAPWHCYWHHDTVIDTMTLPSAPWHYHWHHDTTTGTMTLPLAPWHNHWHCHWHHDTTTGTMTQPLALSLTLSLTPRHCNWHHDTHDTTIGKLNVFLSTLHMYLSPIITILKGLNSKFDRSMYVSCDPCTYHVIHVHIMWSMYISCDHVYVIHLSCDPCTCHTLIMWSMYISCDPCICLIVIHLSCVPVTNNLKWQHTKVD